MNNNKEKIFKFLNNQTVESIFVLILMMYPLRHIFWGLDLWDTGYNYANFEYMGLEHMDSMWLFSTYLANVTGHFLTMLPRAGSLVGMNLYTGLFASVLALVGYLFCTRKLGIPKWIAFVGEFVALSLCWCPTAVLYNYLTYILMLACAILLYQGLTKEKMGYLFAAGVCLGMNVLVRFSNLPEAALIVAVWAYAFIVGMEKKKEQKAESAWAIGFRHTIWCLGGYLSALVVLFGYLHIRYGLDEYIAGIMRLFAMTDNATDYKPTAMIMGVVGTYVQNLYWVIRIVVIVIVGMVVCGIADSIARHCRIVSMHAWCKKLLQWGSRIFCVGLAFAMLYWLYMRGFCSFYFYSYDPIRRPAILFMMLTMLIALVRIFHPKAPKEEKLISGFILLVVLLTSIGSNNEVYPSMNNLFLAAPYTLWQSWRFIVNIKEWTAKKIVVSAFPVKCILTAFLGMFVFQVVMFGANFVFAEATGVQNVIAMVDNNEVLKGVKMNPERAKWFTEISEYVNENELQGREVILYGDIPALSYYLQMPPVFNSWCDLDSFSVEQMELNLQKINQELQENAAQRPVIILKKDYGVYLEAEVGALQASALTTEQMAAMDADAKWQLLIDFIRENGYEQTFQNDKFVMWE